MLFLLCGCNHLPGATWQPSARVLLPSLCPACPATPPSPSPSGATPTCPLAYCRTPWSPQPCLLPPGTDGVRASDGPRLAHAARLAVWSGWPPRGTEARCAPALGLRFCLRSTDSCSSSLLSFPPARMARCTASMLGSMGTSAASSTTTASPTWCPCVCSCHTRTCGFPGLPSSAPA